jgi:hypothetical protein
MPDACILSSHGSFAPDADVGVVVGVVAGFGVGVVAGFGVGVVVAAGFGVAVCFAGVFVGTGVGVGRTVGLVFCVALARRSAEQPRMTAKVIVSFISFFLSAMK